MASSDMAYHRPRSVQEALSLLSADPDARLLAGGQSLVATMNLGLFEPSALIALAGVEGLRGIVRLDDGSVRIGAMTTHAEIAASSLFSGGQRLLPLTANQIADPAVRNFGTIGGACAHGDSIADWPPALVAADARMVVTGLEGTREVPAGEFFLGLFTTAVEAGEILTSIRIPPLAGHAAYRKFTRVDGDYATVSVAVVAQALHGRCKAAAIAVGSCGPSPVRVAEAEALLADMRVDTSLANLAGQTLAAACDPISDVRGSAAYRRRIVPGLVAQTLLEVLAHE
jgi:carbon-monoxide dehydrogenase medium subunit